MKIYIIGFMGSGKSTLGKELAVALQLPFIDLDQEIELLEDLTISEIFSQFGETYFRHKETTILSDLTSAGVYATGGGIVIRQINRELLRQNAECIIWLNTDWKVIWQRIKSSNRPLVNVNSPSQIEELYLQRLPLYQELADIVYQGNDPEGLIKKIKAR